MTSDLTYSFTVTAKTLDALLDAAFERAREFFGDKAEIHIGAFDGFDVDDVRLVSGQLVHYEARCRVRMPMREPTPGMLWQTI